LAAAVSVVAAAMHQTESHTNEKDSLPATAVAPLWRDSLRQVLNVVLAVVQLAAIALVVATPNGVSLNTRAEAEPPVVPAFYAFAIWSFIYPAALAYAVYQALPARREDTLLRRVGFWTASAYLAMTLWANAVQFGLFWLTVPLIFAILAALIGALIQFIRYDSPLTPAERWLVVLPVSVHAGWITVAAVANTASILASGGFRNVGVSDTVWAVALLLVAGLIGSYATRESRGNVGYALTLVWAFVGIAVANAGPAPRVAVLVAAGSMAALVFGTLLRFRRASPGTA